MNGDGLLDLSFLQERSWHLGRRAPESSKDTVAYAFWLRGPLDHDALERGLVELTRRHEALRATFPVRDGRPRQAIAASPRAAFDVVEVASEEEAGARAVAEIERGFDLPHGPLVRARLLRVEPERHLLALTVHHIVTDGISMDLMLGELTALYAALAAGEPSPLGEPSGQYGDFVRRQRQEFGPGGPRRQPELERWRQRLAGADPGLALPGASAAPATEYRGERALVEVPAELTGALRRWAGDHRATLFMALLSAFAALLARHGGQRDLVVGTPVAGRTRRELRGLVGMVSNIVLLRVDLSSDPTLSELLLRVRAACLEDYGHQDLPFEVLAEALGRPCTATEGAPPLYEAWLNLRPERAAFALAGLDVAPADLDSDREVVLPIDACEGEKLNLFLREQDERLVGFLEYNRSVVPVELAERLAGDFVRLLSEVVDDPTGKVHRAASAAPAR